jgi:transposase-like protein
MMEATVYCPKCGSSDVKKVSFTFWGGALGPRLLHHTKCNNCGTTFNRQTGKSNTNAIILYNVVLGAIVFGGCLVCVVFSVLATNGF